MGLTTDRNDPGLKITRPDGQQEAYLVLSDEERAKGFVRPVRTSYRHVGPKPPMNLRDLTPEEQTRYRQFGYVKYEAYPPSESSVVGRFWTQEQLDAATAGGCGTVTTMGSAIAETYARDPKFYGATFCCRCGKHLSVAEFVWEPDGSLLGS